MSILTNAGFKVVLNVKSTVASGLKTQQRHSLLRITDAECRLNGIVTMLFKPNVLSHQEHLLILSLIINSILILSMHIRFCLTSDIVNRAGHMHAHMIYAYNIGISVH